MQSVWWSFGLHPCESSRAKSGMLGGLSALFVNVARNVPNERHSGEAAPGVDPFPLRTRVTHRTRLDALGDLVHLIVGEHVTALDSKLLRSSNVLLDGCAIRSCFSRDLPMTLPRRPATEQLFDINHH